MKKLLLILLLGVSCVSFASVVPTETTTLRKPGMIRTDATKRKRLVTRKVLSDEVGSGFVKDLQRYNGILTVENVQSIENMSRLMQDDPTGLMKTFGFDVEKAGIEIDRRKMGTDEMVGTYIRTPKTDDPAEKMAALRVPELTGSFATTQASKEQLKAMHAQALKQIEEIGHQHLGQKRVSVQMPLTVEDVKKMEINPHSLPKDWEKVLQESEENQKRAKEMGAVSTSEARARFEASLKQNEQVTSKQPKK
ncbi:MAG: hypothetical protein II938_02495 [Alphaproteobacteria bacterium]|nr:hypothetical protein [Alphaproteobacteria bacterium]